MEHFFTTITIILLSLNDFQDINASENLLFIKNMYSIKNLILNLKDKLVLKGKIYLRVLKVSSHLSKVYNHVSYI